MSNGSASTSNRREKAKTAQPWTTTEEITLCTDWCNTMDNYNTRDSMKRGFWSEVFANFEKEMGGLFEVTIPSSSNGNIRFVLKLLRLMSFTIVSNGWTRAGLNLALFQKALAEFETQYGHPFTMKVVGEF
ncbi:hypothetical protein Tco_1356933 [Tanacetum coccineum]